MNPTPNAGILTFLSEAALRGFSEVDLLRVFCERLCSAGVPVARALVLIDTLHPTHEGHAFRWMRDSAQFTPASMYGRVRD
jgi:adenylate cyclase